MPAGDLITVDGQAEVRGLLLGAGTAYPFVDAGPDWWSKPGVRAGDITRPGSSGSLMTLDLSDVWAGTLIVAIVADSPADFAAKRTALALAWATTSADTDLVFQWGGTKQLRRGRTRAMNVGSQLVGVGDIAVAALQFVAGDPLVYNAAAQSGSTGIGTVTGGLTFPLDFPLLFGTATPGSVIAMNTGSAPAPWTAVLAGPLVSPRISHVGQGRALELAGYSLGAGETLVFDSAERTVLLNGVASRYGDLTARDWFALDPGSNMVQLEASSGTGTLTLSWRSASL